MHKCLLIVWYFCWHVIVSVEFLVLFAAVCLYLHCSDVQRFFGSVKPNSELKLFLVAIPIAVSAWIFNEIRKIWWPDVKNRPVLLNWPYYFRLKICCVVAGLYAFSCSASAIFGTVFENCIYDGMGLYLVIASILIVLVDAISCWLATLSMLQLLDSSDNANM